MNPTELYVVRSRCGRDRRRLYLTTGAADAPYPAVTIVNGALHPVDRPKVKNIAHLVWIAPLSEDERAALLSDLAAIEEIEKKIDDLYARLNDNNAESIYDEIDALDDEIVKLLDKNAVLWDKVYEAYDEQVAANEPDMTWELTEKDFPLCG